MAGGEFRGRGARRIPADRIFGRKFYHPAGRQFKAHGYAGREIRNSFEKIMLKYYKNSEHGQDHISITSSKLTSHSFFLRYFA